MKSDLLDRRGFLGTCAAAATLLPLSSLAATPAASAAARPLRILCVGGHPDDPETGCGGTLAKFAAAGHAVTLLYLTRGDAGIPGKSKEEAAAIRTREAEAACAILKARPLFFRDLDGRPQIDAETFVDEKAIRGMRALLKKEDPDLIFAHWPIDGHRDHQLASVLTTRAWMDSDRRAPLYFYEVMTGEQTMGFAPTDYVDITDFQEVKRKAENCHVSQNVPKVYTDHHGPMERFRGREIGVEVAEAFVRLAGNRLAVPERTRAS